jgi:peptidoglycan-N-acetylglucosamine deacetylase
MAYLDEALGEFSGIALRMNQQYTLSGRWAPAPLLYASAALHLGAVGALLTRPGAWPWALGTVIANHMALAGAGLWPRSQLLGPNWNRLPIQAAMAGGVAITIDDGPDPTVTPQVLEQLDQHRACATFFCVGERVLRFKDLAQEIVRRGHSMENHSQRHRHNFSLLGPRAMHNEISLAQDSIFQVTGSRPVFFRAPAGLRNPFLDPVLAHLKLRLASWTRRGFDTVNGNAQSVYERLANSLGGGDILLLHDGNAARGGNGKPVILEVLPRLLDAVTLRDLKPITLRSALS